MPPSSTASNASTATQVSRRRVLRWYDIYDGMMGRAAHSIKHAVVNALTSVIPPSSLAQDSILLRDLEALNSNRGKFRPFLCLEKPRGHDIPARIVLMTHFSGRPIQEVDKASQALAVALGSVTPPWPEESSPRIAITPEWKDKNSYALAFAIKLEYGRYPKRYRSAGVEYKVDPAELEILRELCEERAEALADMTPEELAELQQSYETHVATYKTAESSYGGSAYTAAPSRITTILPSITEDALTDEKPEEEVPEETLHSQDEPAAGQDDDEEFIPVKPRVKRRRSTANRGRR